MEREALSWEQWAERLQWYYSYVEFLFTPRPVHRRRRGVQARGFVPAAAGPEHADRPGRASQQRGHHRGRRARARLSVARGPRGRMGRPVRRVLSGGRSPVDGHLSRRHVAVPLQRPTRGLGEPRQHPLSGLAPGEVYLAGRVTTTPVVSYTAVSPLPRPKPRRSVLCGTVSRITPGGCYPPPCPVEPGRSSALRGEPRATRPSSRPIRVAESSPAICGSRAGARRAQSFCAVSAIRRSSGKSIGKSPNSSRAGGRRGLAHRLRGRLGVRRRRVHDDLVVQEERQVRPRGEHRARSRGGIRLRRPAAERRGVRADRPSTRAPTPRRCPARRSCG